MKKIIESLKDAGDFTTLAGILETAGLIEVLTSEEPHTLLAPTDDAFDSLPPGILDGIIREPEKLEDFLKYHIIEGKYSAKDLETLGSLKTLQGRDISVEKINEDILIDESKIIQADIECTNGVIHAIDMILVPPPE